MTERVVKPFRPLAVNKPQPGAPETPQPVVRPLSFGVIFAAVFLAIICAVALIVIVAKIQSDAAADRKLHQDSQRLYDEAMGRRP